jgi:SEL1 protein
VRRDIESGARFLRHAADAGQPDAQAGLAFLHATGIAERYGVEKNSGKALVYWNLAAETGSVVAQIALGYRHLVGHGVPKSCAEAARHYRLAARAIATDPRHVPSLENFLVAQPPLPTGLTNEQNLRFEEKDVDAAFADRVDTSGDIGGADDRDDDVGDGYDMRSRGGQDQPSEPFDEPLPNVDDTELVEYYRMTAAHGDPSALTVMGGLNLFGGHGVAPNEQLAREFLEAAGVLGHGEANAMLAHLALKRSDNQTAFNYFSRSSEANSRMGHFGLGMFHLHGIGMDENLGRAALHFKFAADMRHPDAAYHIGMMLWQGKGVAQNTAEAYRYFQIGAKRGQLQCALNLGLITLEGNFPVPRPDCDRGVAFLKTASETGEWAMLQDLAKNELDAHRPFGALYRQLQAANVGIEVAQFNAAMLLEKSVVSGSSAMRELGHWDRQRRADEALALYELSGMQGHSSSMLRAGNLAYYSGGIDNSDAQKRSMYFDEGNGADDSAAAGGISWTPSFRRWEGEGDFLRAALYYEKGSRLGDAESSVTLGWMYACGIGVLQNRRHADYYFNLAQEQAPEAFIPASIAHLGARALWMASDFNTWLSRNATGSKIARIGDRFDAEEDGRSTATSGWAANSDLMLAFGLGGLLTVTLYARRRRMTLHTALDP